MDLFMMEAALTLQTSAARKARQANDVVALLEVQDPGSHIPPRLSASDEADMAAGRMESLGRHVGANLTEILLRDKPRLPDTLDRVKFVCKELWSVVWNKQIDNLRTNHRGVFVLQDQAFRALMAVGPMQPMSTSRCNCPSRQDSCSAPLSVSVYHAQSRQTRNTPLSVRSTCD